MTFAVFPSDGLFDPETEDWKLGSAVINGGVSVLGGGQLARTDGGGLWMCAQTGIEIYTRDQLLAASALDFQLEGGAASIIVPFFAVPFRPVPPGSDFAVSIRADASAALRATTLIVSSENGFPLQGGEYFSLTHTTRGKRLYGVKSASEPVQSGSRVVQTITIRPPLREAISANAPLDFETPGCVMRLANPKEWLSPLDAAHERVAQPTWVEHFDAVSA